MTTDYLETLNRNFDDLKDKWPEEVKRIKNWHADYQMMRLLSAELAEREIPLELPCGL